MDGPRLCLPSLSAVRKQSGLSLEEISELTKIKVSWLQAIEDGRWGDLPDGIYRRSYVRQYARATGIDEQVLLSCCQSTVSNEI